jgi:hypothetical protein
MIQSLDDAEISQIQIAFSSRPSNSFNSKLLLSCVLAPPRPKMSFDFSLWFKTLFYLPFSPLTN